MKLNFGKITVDAIKDSLTDGIKQAQLRQIVTKQYDAVKAGNSLSDSFFESSEIKAGGSEFTETRMFWQKVSDTTTLKEMEERIAMYPDATIRKILSLKPIISDTQEQVYYNGLTKTALEDFCANNGLEAKTVWDDECREVFMAKIHANQLVVYGEGNSEGKPADEPVLYKGQKQYRLNTLSLVGAEDIDKRSSHVVVTESIPLTAEVKEEVAEKVN